MMKRFSWLTCLLLSSSLMSLPTEPAHASAQDALELQAPGTPSPSPEGLKLENLFSALPAVDTESFEASQSLKSLRGTWQAYDPELVAYFLSGELRVLDPQLFEKNLPWDALTEEDKQGIPAIAALYAQNKALMAVEGVISEEEAQSTWESLGEDRQQDLPLEWLLPSQEGLAECRGIGCAQFSRNQLIDVIRFIEDHDNVERTQKLSQKMGLPFEDALASVEKMRATGALKTSITIIDHREEPHLHLEGREALANGPEGLSFSPEVKSLPMSFYAPGDAFSKGRSNLEVEVIEGKLIRRVQAHKTLTLSLITEKEKGLLRKADLKTYHIQAAYSERDLAHSLDLGYGRVPITDHHAIEAEDGDYLKIAYDALPKGTYVIHHCRGGKGRTETGLTTRDMMFNEDKPLTLLDFVLRHVLIGGTNLLGPLIGEDSKDWKKPQAYERAKSLASFYTYTRSTEKGVRLLYRDWLREQKSGKAQMF